MSRKSRRNRARQPGRSQRVPEARLAPAPPPVVVEPKVTTSAPVAPVSKPVSKTAVAGVRADHVLAEMRRIGILAGIMLVILVILVIILA